MIVVKPSAISFKSFGFSSTQVIFVHLFSFHLPQVPGIKSKNLCSLVSTHYRHPWKRGEWRRVTMCGGVIVCFTCGPLLSLNARLHQTIPSIHPYTGHNCQHRGRKYTNIRSSGLRNSLTAWQY